MCTHTLAITYERESNRGSRNAQAVMQQVNEAVHSDAGFSRKKRGYSRESTWFQMYSERAAVWDTLGAHEQLVGYTLVHLSVGDERLRCSLEVARKRVLFATGTPRERLRMRKALDHLQKLGLLFEHEGETYVLFSLYSHNMYKSLGESKRPKVETPKEAEKTGSEQEDARKMTGRCQEDGRKQELNTENHSESTPPIHREETKSLPSEETGAPPPGPKKARPKDARKELWSRLLGEAAKRHGFLSAKLLSIAHTQAVIAKAVEHAETAGVELEAAMIRLLDEAHKQHVARGKDLKWCLVDWQPGAPLPKQWGRPKLEIAGCSPAHEFGTEEEAWAKLRAKQAAREARRAAEAANVA